MTASNNELLDILNPDGTPTGKSKPRDAVHQDGDWHRTFHLWILKDNGKTLLMQRRAKQKTIAPNKIDVTVGGHYQTGETLNDVLRETEEEIGISVYAKQLQKLESRGVERCYGGIVDREFQDVFVLLNEQPLSAYFLDCAEVSVLYEAPLAGVIALYESGGFLPVSGFDCQQRRNDALLIEDDLIAEAREDTLRSLYLMNALFRF